MENEFTLGDLNELEDLEADDSYFVRIWPPDTQGDSSGETTDTVETGGGEGSGREEPPDVPEVDPVTEPVYVRLWPPLDAQSDSSGEMKDEN